MFIKDFRKEFYDLLIDSHVLVFVNYDVDAVCACKIISYLFKCDNIQHTVVPISDLNDLLAAFKDRRNSSKYILMINIGATFDVIDLLEPEEEQIIFVADNHRPIDVYNVYRENELRLIMKSDDTDPIPLYEELFRDGSDDEDDEMNDRRFSLEELEKRKEIRGWEEKRRKILFEYSQFSYFGQSVSYIFLEIAWSLGKDCDEVLWLAIIGVTEMLISSKIELTGYENMCRLLKNHLNRLSHHDDVRNPDDSTSDSLLAKKFKTSITYAKDLQLSLYRHWSLFESLRHTLFISCKFKVWNIKGHKRLLEFLAELGMPLIQCKQKYDSMDLEFRKNLLAWVEDLIEKYELENIIGSTFLLKKSFRGCYSANDVAFAVRALLESANPNQSKYDRFFEAQEALSWQVKTPALDKGIDLAKVQHITILKQIHDTIDMRMVTSSGPFLCCILPESIPDVKLFVYPSFLLHFAKYLLSAFIASTKNRRVINLPLIVLVTDPNRPEISLAVGVPPLAEDSGRNLFGKAFIQAGQLLKCEIEPDLFDVSIIRFPTDEKARLLEALVSLLSA